MSMIVPPPRQDKDLTGHAWQDWFFKLQKLLYGIEHIDQHWYLTNGVRHAIVDCTGAKTTTTTVGNTTTETQIYAYQLSTNELHLDSLVEFVMYGSVSSATGTATLTVRYKVGGVTQKTLVVTPGNNVNIGWSSIYTGTVRTTGASGTFVDYAKFETDTSKNSSASSTAASINTTIPNLFEITVQWSAAAAGNTVSCTQGIITYYH